RRRGTCACSHPPLWQLEHTLVRLERAVLDEVGAADDEADGDVGVAGVERGEVELAADELEAETTPGSLESERVGAAAHVRLAAEALALPLHREGRRDERHLTGTAVGSTELERHAGGGIDRGRCTEEPARHLERARNGLSALARRRQHYDRT